MSIDQAIEAIKEFQGASLTQSIARIEKRIIGMEVSELENLCKLEKINGSFLTSARSIKKLAGQINVIIHAAGILRSLPMILEKGEKVESVSLGAGNTGKKFDLETNLRVAEYKFIDWQGGSETIRQNGIFKDFFELAESNTEKRKFLYVVGVDWPTKFLNGGRALSSVLSRHHLIAEKIAAKYGPGIKTVCDYYTIKKQDVTICDVEPLL